jgi:hypothetical protein
VQVAPAGNWVLPSGRVAWKPQVVLAPAPRLAFWLAIPRAVTVWPLTVTVAFQELVMVCPAGYVKVTVQPLMALVPVLVTVLGWKTYPFCHEVCVVSVAEQPPGPPPPDVVALAMLE